MRKKKNLAPRMERCAHLLIDWEDREALNLADLNPEGRPIALEIGCGKGRFITQTAAAHPEWFFIAMEREENALVMALEQACSASLDNLRFLLCDAARLPELFPKESLRRIYINFCDPWPHNRHAKRRLTHRNFLSVYEQLLLPGGDIHFKTDNAALFEFSLNQLAAYEGLRMREISLDLHASGRENIMTEYEEKFSSQGMKICRLEAFRPERTV